MDVIFFFKQKTAYEIKECDWSSDVCSSDLKSQNICVNVARTILPDGTEVEAAPDAEHDITPPGLADYNLYSDIRNKVVSMPALQPDAIIEYKVTVEDKEASSTGMA